jgi:hypothetical protein
MRTSKAKAGFLAAVSLIAVAWASAAQAHDGDHVVNKGLEMPRLWEYGSPGNMIDQPVIPPDVIATQDERAEDEVPTDLDFFMGSGYRLPNFDTYYDLRHAAAKELIIPDYVQRNGIVPPDDSMVQIAAAYITEGDFNDLIVFSNMPGDCDAQGCMAMVYNTTDGLKWHKLLQFKAYALVYRSPKPDRKAEVVAVGNAEFPSRYFDWNGISFVERK